ncbi:MAG: carboxypeptidase regulatory-like domain-containing protein [Saprospiraceae bacterium]|nr:carboxypeptidase regulatory-like domain-containing protein [Saprospiraceae bacterium]HNA58045.1 carboxypeptidase regulatory-like domain-containing protein [Chitinophagales bacterium]HMX89660.1 carboxypeptidase regulatory-like domain-containing protein [Saprospiraceae bacterium]HMZ41072.1 carboxypeptidase regulatory-like domain-containing protein [Saprospiraceae bacterium]HNC36926.1 carboxypeptidase regulatory-like domain-containing protein [Saprospiraceae bacterium]
MKQIYYLLTAMLFLQNASSQILKNCLNSCDLPSANWSTVQCENYELLGVGQDLLTSDWFLYPSSSVYFPVSAKVGVGQIGSSWVKYADFTYNGQPVDNYFRLNFGPKDYRFNFSVYLFQNQRAQLAIKDDSNNDILYLEFTSTSIVNIYNSSKAKIGSFPYSQNTWVAMSAFYHNDGRLEIFRNNYKVGGFKNVPTGAKTFPSRYDFFSDKSGDGFLLGGVCVATQNGFQVLCTQEFDPVCLKGTGEQVANNACFARVAGYYENEFQKCGVNSDPCDDCDECFNYWFDCSGNRKVYFQNNYCDVSTPTFSGGTGSGRPATEYEWEFRNESNVVVQPEFFNGTNSTSYSPICRLPVSGTYTVCLRVYKYNSGGRYVAFLCCYTIKVAAPCKSSPTLYITSTSPNSNNEVTFTTTSAGAETYSWRTSDNNALISGQSTTASGFKCKIPAGRNCITVCLTVGNACGMTSECITVCSNSAPCGNKPPLHPPITYTVNANNEVSFTNIPQMDSYQWIIPGGCAFTGGTSSGSRNPICKLPDPGCSYLFCLKMRLGDCYVLCYCFTIVQQPAAATIIFDPDEMTCVSPGSQIKVPVRVRGFSTMTSVDLTYTIAPSGIARFETAEAGPNVDPASIIPNKINDSKMTVGWVGTSGSGTTLQDNDILYYLVLTATGSANTSATISVDGASAKIKQNRVAVSATLKTGSVCINGSYKICGKITREDNVPVKGVTVELSGASSQTATTDQSGAYCFANVAAGNYVIRPTKKNNPGNGVELADIADIKGHLLRTFTLPSAYRMIAADVDNSKSITATDIARIIPTYKDKARVFVNVDSWRFVPTSYQFPNPANPFQSSFPESASLQLTKDVAGVDFVGIKMGDTDLDNDPQNITDPQDQLHSISKLPGIRTAQDIDLIIPSDTVRPGSVLKIPVYCKGFKQVISFGFSVNWQNTKLKFLSVDRFNSKLNLTKDGFGLQNTDKGNLGVTWYTFDLNGVNLSDNEPLFYINYQVLASDREELNLTLSNNPTPVTFASNTDNFNVRISQSKILIDSKAVAVSDQEKQFGDMEFFPNPVDNDLFIHLTGDEILANEIIFTDVAGHGYAVPMITTGPSVCKLNVNHLPPGLYLIKVKGIRRMYTGKLIRL